MSIKAMTIVWEHSPYDGNTLLTLLALADMADDAGVCWPSVETLALKTRQSIRNVQRCLAQIASDGYLNRTLRRDTSSLYQLLLTVIRGDKLSPPPGDTAGTTGVTKQADGVTNRVVQKPCVSPKPSGTVIRTVSESSDPPVDTSWFCSKPDDDVRHQYLIDYFYKAFCKVNDVQDIPNMKAVAANTRVFLREHPERSYPLARIYRCIDNWATSHPKWHTFAKPWSIILVLEKFSKGPLDEFNAQIGVTLDKATVKSHEQSQRLATELDYIASLSTRQHGNKL